MKKIFSFCVLLVIALPALTACEIAALGSAGTYLHKKFSDDANRRSMQSANYTAADIIATQARYKLDKFTPIQIGTFTNVGDTDIDPALGEAIGDQLGERFFELGFTVGRVVQKEPGYMKRPNAVLQADYKVVKTNVNVDLKMVEEGTGRLLSKTNYDIAMKDDVRKLGKLENPTMKYLINYE